MTVIKPILRGGIRKYEGTEERLIHAQRVLTPSEYDLIWKASGKFSHQLKLDLCLLTAGRYSELRELQVNKQWFDPDHNAIHIPEHKAKRLKRGVTDRYIHLSRKGVDMVRTFLHSGFYKLPAYSTMEDNMKRWAIKADVDTTGLSIKSLRKTYESWLIMIYPEKSISILQSTGHTQKVSMEHYANLPFTDRDILLMKPYVEGWI
jgi:integrase